MNRLLLTITLLLLYTAGRAATNEAASTSYADVSTAYGLCSAGDTLLIPSGTVDWGGSKPLVLNKGGVHVRGYGTNNTILQNTDNATSGLESSIFDVRLDSDAVTVIYDIKFQDPGGYDQGISQGSAGITTVSNNGWNSQLVLSNVNFEGFAAALRVYGNWGLLCNSTFDENDIHLRFQGFQNSNNIPTAGYWWGFDSTNYFVVEDCEFRRTSWTLGTYSADAEYPMNYMVRYCNFFEDRGANVDLDGFDMHGESGGDAEVPLGIVIYSNRWVITTAQSDNTMLLADIRGGAHSLIFSNEIVNSVGTFNGDVLWRDDPLSGPILYDGYYWKNVDEAGDMGYIFEDGIGDGAEVTNSLPDPYNILQYPHPLRLSGDSSPSPVLNFRNSSISFFKSL